jgi:hypothetical protein
MRNLRNLTITVSDEVARWARLRAAHGNKSLSRMVGEMLAETMRGEDGYERAMKQFLAAKPGKISGGGRYPSRDEVHERPRLR